MAASEEEFNKIFTIRRTLMQMLRDRGYDVTDFEVNMSKNDFRLMYSDNVKRHDLFISKAKKDDDSDKIYVFFHEEPKVGVEEIKAYLDRMKSDMVFRTILVVQQKLSAYALRLVGETPSKFHLEVFQESELLVNVTDHVFVPEHKVLTDSEKKTLLETYTVNETQLPRIQITDPVARYYGVTRGQIVRISRDSETCGKYITYRYAV